MLKSSILDVNAYFVPKILSSDYRLFSKISSLNITKNLTKLPALYIQCLNTTILSKGSLRSDQGYKDYLKNYKCLNRGKALLCHIQSTEKVLNHASTPSVTLLFNPTFFAFSITKVEEAPTMTHKKHPGLYTLFDCPLNNEYRMRQSKRAHHWYYFLVVAGWLALSNTTTQAPHKRISADCVLPFVTFIVPTVGRSTLHQTIHSLLNQTNPHWEAIVVFDGVTNITYSDPRIKAIQIPKTGKSNYGGEVRNQGMQHAKTDWIAFVDDDDHLSADYVDRLIEEISLHPSLEVVIFRMFHPHQARIMPALQDTDFKHCQVGISFCIRAALFHAGVKFRPGHLEDFDLLHDLRIQGRKMVISPYITYWVRETQPTQLPNPTKGLRASSFLEGKSLRDLVAFSRKNPLFALNYLRGSGCARLAGSAPAVLGAALHQSSPRTQLFILQDQETASYFYTDLLNLLDSKPSILLYPALANQSNHTATLTTAANLLRNEILQQLRKSAPVARMIITYPEALATRVIGEENLSKTTWTLHLEETISLTDLSHRLIEQGFDKVEFVYEAGQFAVRGGIVDIFSYANQLPYRIELVGNQIENMRLFNPADQLSIETVTRAVLFSYTHPLNKKITYQSFLDCLPNDTLVWLQDYESALHVLQECPIPTNRADAPEHHLPTMTQGFPNEKHIDLVYEDPLEWQQRIQKFTCIEFGNRSYLKNGFLIDYKTSPQPSFNQQFNLLADNLQQNQASNLTNFILVESISQFERLSSMFDTLDTPIQLQTLPLRLSQGYIDYQTEIACYTDHQIFGRYYRYKTPQQYSKRQAFTLKELNALQPGDYVVHMDYGIARFAGLSKMAVNNKEQEALRLIYKDNDVVYLSLQSLHKISKYAGKDGLVPAMSKLGSTAWDLKKKKVKSKVQDIAKELIQLYGKRKCAPGFPFSKDTTLQAEMESSFIYEDTPDQLAATIDVKKDMESPHPMDRLICGDVGFGKTEVAIRAAFKAVQDGKQVAVLVPTTILALQHYESFKKRLGSFPVSIAYINRFKPKQEIEKIQQGLTAGKIDIVIGTHTILGKSFQFKDLGLLIVDEEQKFGVKAKERIKELKVNVDVLTLTATPIPRTLHFSLMGARDLSIISTPPPNRQPVHTAIHTFDKKVIQEAIHYEVQRGGQVFFVHNRIANIQEIAGMIQKLVPTYRIDVAHGQMSGDLLEKKVLQFIAGEYDILVATNIIESGLDIPNANTIIINDSYMFGLSDLHQMRGRVGRSNKKAFCYLIAPPNYQLTDDARKRLSALEEFSDLGDGFKVAMRDLDIRGAGNLLGEAQSGFIADVGFETYCQILNEAVQELKENDFKALFTEESTRKSFINTVDCTLETDLELLIPTHYVSNDSERLKLYTQLDNIENETALEKFRQELLDRFGPLPKVVAELMQAVQLRWLAKGLFLQKVKLKDNSMRCYFMTSPPQEAFADKFTSLLHYVHRNPQRCQLKNTKDQLSLTINTITTVGEAYQVLTQLGQ
eukprot:gene1026-1301_t